MRLAALLLLFELLWAAGPAAAVDTLSGHRVCRTSSHGALPGPTYATAGLQAAINACHSDCGIVLVDRPGTYLSAALTLGGCVHLEVPAGVTLLAGTQVRGLGGDATGPGLRKGVKSSG